MSALRLSTPAGGVTLIPLGPGRGMTHARTLAVGGCLIQAEALRLEAATRKASKASAIGTPSVEEEEARSERRRAQYRAYYHRNKATAPGTRRVQA